MNELYVKIIRGIISLLGRLPLKFHYFMGDVLSSFAKNVLKYRYDVVMINLARSFPDLKYGALKKIADDYYRHFGEIFAETIWFGGSDYGRLRRQGICRVTNPEILNEAFAASPGVTLLNSHCGNWEILGGLCAYNDMEDKKTNTFSENQIYVVYKRQRSDVWNEVFLRNRTCVIPAHFKYNGVVEAANILRFSLKNKDSKGLYIYPADQYPYRSAYDIGKFLNQDTKAMIGSMGVANRLGMSVIYMSMRRVERGRYEMTYVKLCDDASKYAPEQLLRMYFDELEKEILQEPSNWLWSHKRWK